MVKSLDNNRKKFLELTYNGVGKTRHKAIHTIMMRRGVSYEKALEIQAKAIVRNERQNP